MSFGPASTREIGNNLDCVSVAAIPARVLLNQVYSAVHQVDWPGSAIPRDTPEPVLRTILTYSYAVGILSCQDIQAACLHDSNVRYICARNFPSWQTIREFRRRNLPWIQQSLENLFLALDPALALRDARQIASRRLARAIQADSIALDV